MKKLIGEVLVAALVVLAVADGMQLLSALSVWMHSPLDKTYIAGASICYVVYRTMRDKGF